MALGRPKGSLNDKPWKDAIRKAVARRAEEGSRALDKLAESLVGMGLAGDVSALKEIGDRLDGKATQTIEATVTERMVMEAPQPAKDADEWSKANSVH